MNRVARIDQFFRHTLWTVDLSTLTVLQRAAVQALRLAIAVGLEFRHRLLDARAAGLVYTTLLSLVPVLAVMFSVLKAFGVHQQIEPVLAQALDPLGPKGREITTQIIGFVDNMKVGVLGVVGVAGLFYTTYSLIDKIEQALNAIWRVRQGRPWARKFTDYLSVVLVGPVVVATALGLIGSVQSSWFVQWVIDRFPLGFVLVWAAEFMPLLLLTGLFTFFYKFIPNTGVRVPSALVGGLTAALLWMLAGGAFAKFVAGSAKYSAIYSGFAILILFLLWLYVSWLIILIGAQVSFFHQHPSAYQSHLLWQQRAHAFREQLALGMLVAVTRRYLGGARPYREQELATELNLPVSIVEEQAEHLVERGILCRVAEPVGIALIKPPELVTVKAVLDVVREDGSAAALPWREPADAVSQLLRRRDEAVEHALLGATLRTLVAPALTDSAEGAPAARAISHG